MIKITYLMIPKELIYDTKTTEKRILLFSYFAIRRGLDDIVGFSCNGIVKWCGYEHNYNKNKINDEITTILSYFIKNGYLEIAETSNRNNYSEAIILQEKFDLIPQFALIYVDEIEKIRKFLEYSKDIKNRMSSAILILILSYLRVNMLRRQDKYIGKESDKPEFCYRMYIDMEKDLGISRRYISTAVKILNNMDLIVSQEMPRYKDENGNWHTEVTMFTNRYRREKGGDSLDKNYDYVRELEWGKEYIKKRKYLNKKFDQNT